MIECGFTPSFYEETRNVDSIEQLFCEHALLEKLESIGYKSLLVNVPHNGRGYEGTEDTFCINIWAFVRLVSGRINKQFINSEEWGKYAKTAWGHNLQCTDSPYHASGLGIPITTPEGWDIAEYLPQYHCLNIHFDAVHTGNEEEYFILDILLDNLSSLFDGIEDVKELIKRTSEEAFVAFLNRTWETKIRTLERDKSEYEERIRQTRRTLTRYVKTLESVKTELNLINIAGENMKEKLKSELKQINDLEKVEKIQFGTDRFTVFTNDIYAYDEEDNRYYIGKFKIDIEPDTSTILFENLNNRRLGLWNKEEGDHHPHISGDDRQPCWGNLASTIAELTARSEYFQLVQMLIAYLESVNTDDEAGEYIVNWDMVDEDGNVIQEGYNAEAQERYVCDECGFTSTDKDDFVICGVCEEYVCMDCATYVESEGVYACDTCLSEEYSVCCICEEYYLDNDTYVCENCGDRVCSDCAVFDADGNAFCNDACLSECHSMDVLERGDE